MENFKKILYNKKIQMIAIDVVILCIAHSISFLIANSLPFVNLRTLAVLPEMIIFILFNILSLITFKVYNNIWRYAHIGEFVSCVAAVTIGSAAAIILQHPLSLHTSNIFMLLTCLFSIIGICSSRFLYCYIYELMIRREIRSKQRTLIVGAGEACHEIIREMYSSSACQYKPTVIVDDNPIKLNRRINSVPIEGSTEDIPRLVEIYNIKTILFAIPSCDAKNKKRIMDICSKTGCAVKTIPFLHEIIDINSLLDQIQPININDLLGRDVISFENSMQYETITDKVCMVTGGGGSIGSELCRQIAKHKPKTLVIVEIYENNAYDIQQELIRKYGEKLDLQIQIASVRDYDKMELLFARYRPDLVFHAAAHKHVPLMETNPEEAIKNNIFGTYNAASLAEKYGAEKFVLVSTDKAVNPTNVMGATKRCCEMVVQYMAQFMSKTEFIAVRFGNVLGSNGSVIPLFEKQIAENRPVTVTHPEIIRYFMTIPEAVSLILEAATIARGGEIFVLDMGEPVKILTLAENLIRMHGREPYTDVKIVFSGLRPGEKLYEELLMDEEGLRSTANNRIFVGQQIHVSPNEFIENLRILKDYADANDVEACVSKLSEIVPTFAHNAEQTAVS